jgi:hypothetical protein
VPLDDEHISVRRDRDVVRLIQLARARGFVPLTGLALGTERQQHLAGGIQLDDDMAADVGRPQVSLGIDLQPVRAREHPLAERTHECTVRVELDEGLRAPGQHVQVSARVERNGRRRTHRHAGRNRHRIGNGDIIEDRRRLGNEESRIRGPLRKRSRAEQDERKQDGQSFHGDLRGADYISAQGVYGIRRRTRVRLRARPRREHSLERGVLIP